MGRLLQLEQNRNILSRHNPERNILYDRIVVYKRFVVMQFVVPRARASPVARLNP